MQTSYLSRNRIDAILGQKSLAHESGYSERVGSVAFFRKIELSLQSRARFADLIVQKCSATVRLFTFSTANRTLARSCALFLESFSRSRPGRAETQTLLSRPLYTLQRHKVSRPKMSSPANSHASELLYSPLQLPVANCYCCLCG